MRAKNEFRLISEAYDIKLLAEKAVDGTLMCSKDCCGSPVMECKCGDDCPHCNCFMIQKAVKDFGLKSPLLEGIVPEDERDEPIRNRKLPVGHYEHRVRLSRGGRWDKNTVQVPKADKKLIQIYLDKGFEIERPAEDYERFENPYDDYVDDDAREQARRDDKLMGDIELPPDYKPTSSEDVKKRMAALDREIKMAHARGREDNEEFNKLENKRERARDRAREAEDKGDWDEWNRQENERERARDQLKDIEDNEDIEYENPATRRKEAQRAANERAHKKWQDPEYWKKFGVKGLGLDTPKEDNEEPKRSITGMKRKLDALAAAQLAGSKHKPYVSSFVGSGGKKIFAVLGSNGKIAHKTHNKQEAHQWLKDNYENI